MGNRIATVKGLKVACLEEIAFQSSWIDAEKLKELAAPMAKNQYGQYLLQLAEEPPGRNQR